MQTEIASSRIAVTGAAGFIGSALVNHLHTTGTQVLALSSTARSWPAGIRSVPLTSYEDPQELVRIFEGVDAVVHLAARAHRGGNPAEFESNVRSARAIAQACVAAAVRRLVFISSIGVNGNLTVGRPFTEDDLPDPAEPYAHSKLEGENAVFQALSGTATTWTVLRPPLVYGPRAPGNFAKLVHAVQRGWVLPVAGVRNARTLLALDNLLQLMQLCLTHPKASNELFLAGDGEDISTPELLRQIGRGLGKPARMINVPPSLLRAGATLLGRSKLADSLCASLQVNTSKARRVLGWVPKVRPGDAIADAVREGRIK